MVLLDSKQRRRIQITGGSTYVISLPKRWINDLKIKVGDEMTLIKNLDRSLTLLTNENRFEKKNSVIELGIEDSIEAIKRKIIALYLAGYKTIKIRSKGIKIQPIHSRIIRETARDSLIGTEIVESTSEYVTIQVLTRLPELTFDVALQRMYLMAYNMQEEAIDALEKMDIDAAQEVVKMDDEVDRFSMYMLRNLSQAIQSQEILSEIGLKKPTDCLGYRTVIRCIERIADHSVLIAKRIKFLQNPIEKKTFVNLSQLSQASLKIFEKAFVALSKNDYFLAEEVAEQAEKDIQNEKDFMASLKEVKNSYVIRFILEDIRRIIEYSKDIAEEVINENIRTIISEK